MKKVRLAACAVALSVGGLSPLGLSPAAADTAASAVTSGYGLNLDLAGTPAIDKAGLATSTLPPGGNFADELFLAPVEPVILSGTARGMAATNAESVLLSELEQVTQAVPGPYNAVGVGLVEDLGVLLNVAGDINQALVSASAVRGEAVGVCRNGAAVYSANSEVADLNVGGMDVGVNNPVTDLLGTVNSALAGLQVIEIKLNEVNVTATGATVTALHVTVLGALAGVPIAGQDPVADIIVGHAEVGGLQCAPRPQCSDTTDNDGDGQIDANDPGCINNGVYDPNDDDERNTLPRTTATGPLPRTGGDSSTTLPMAGGFAALALGALALRRRSQSSS